MPGARVFYRPAITLLLSGNLLSHRECSARSPAGQPSVSVVTVTTIVDVGSSAASRGRTCSSCASAAAGPPGELRARDRARQAIQVRHRSLVASSESGASGAWIVTGILHSTRQALSATLSPGFNAYSALSLWFSVASFRPQIMQQPCPSPPCGFAKCLLATAAH